MDPIPAQDDQLNFWKLQYKMALTIQYFYQTPLVVFMLSLLRHWKYTKSHYWNFILKKLNQKKCTINCLCITTKYAIQMEN